MCFYVVNDADAYRREVAFEGLQRSRLRSGRFVGWHGKKMFALPPSERNDFYTLVSSDWYRKPNGALEVPSPMTLSNFVDHLRAYGSRVLEHVRCMAEVEVMLTVLRAF